MLTDTKKEYFKQLLSRMLNEALRVDSKSFDEADRVNIGLPDPSDRAMAESELTFSLRMQERKSGGATLSQWLASVMRARRLRCWTTCSTLGANACPLLLIGGGPASRFLWG